MGDSETTMSCCDEAGHKGNTVVEYGLRDWAGLMGSVRNSRSLSVDDGASSSQQGHPCIKHGQVWKLGRMWSVGSSFRLWRTRYLVVQDGYALLYTQDKCWRTLQEPKCRVKLRGARVDKHIASKSTGRWVFSIKGDNFPKEVFLAAGTDLDRDLWIIALRSAIANAPNSSAPLAANEVSLEVASSMLSPAVSRTALTVSNAPWSAIQTAAPTPWSKMFSRRSVGGARPASSPSSSYLASAPHSVKRVSSDNVRNIAADLDSLRPGKPPLHPINSEVPPKKQLQIPSAAMNGSSSRNSLLAATAMQPEPHSKTAAAAAAAADGTEAAASRSVSLGMQGGLGPVVGRNLLHFSHRSVSSYEANGVCDTTGELEDEESGSSGSSSGSTSGSENGHSDVDDDDVDDECWVPSTTTTRVRHALIGRSTTHALCEVCAEWFSAAGRAPRLRAVRHAWDSWRARCRRHGRMSADEDLAEELDASRREVKALRARLDGKGGGEGELAKHLQEQAARIEELQRQLVVSAEHMETVVAQRDSKIEALTDKLAASERADAQDLVQLGVHELLALLDEKDAEVESLKAVCAELEQAVEAVEGGQAELDARVAVKLRVKDEEIQALVARNEELHKLVDGAQAAEQLLTQIEQLRQSRGPVVAADDSAAPQLVKPEEHMRVVQERDRLQAQVKAMQAEMEEIKVSHMRERERLVLEAKVAVQSREHAETIMSKIVDDQQLVRASHEKEVVSMHSEVCKAWAEARDFIAQIKRDTESAAESRASLNSIGLASWAKGSPQRVVSTAVLVKSLPIEEKESAVC